MRTFLEFSFLLSVLVAGCDGKLAPSSSADVDLLAVSGDGVSSGGSTRGATGASAETLAEVNTDVVAIAVDDSDVYAIDKFGGLFAVQKSGVGAHMIRDSSDAYEYPGGLVVDDGFLYWSVLGFSDSDGKILRMPKQGGAVETVADHQARPHGIAVDGSRVFWTNEGVFGPIGTAPTGGAVMSARKEGGEVVTLAHATRAYALALDETNIYFSSGPWGDRNGSVGRLPKAGGSITILADGRGMIPTLAVDERRVVWTEDSSLAASMPIDGGAVTDLFAGESPAEVSTGVAAAGGDAFFGAGRVSGRVLAATSAGDSRVVSPVDLPKDGTMVAFIAVAMAVDTTRLYWVDSWATYDSPSTHAAIRAATR